MKYFIISDLSNQAGVEAARKILGWNTLPDGIFAANDTSAVSTMCELKRAGIRIPEDVAVVGFNNDPVSSVVEPNLTTIHYPGNEIGEIAASSLINMLDNTQSDIPDSIVLSHSLIVRGSSLRSAAY